MAKTRVLHRRASPAVPAETITPGGLILPLKRGEKELRAPTKREVPVEWERELADFSPPTNRFSYLKLLWEPGYPWEHVERYLIYQMIPAHAIPEMILEQLQHPLPPSKMGNYYDRVLQEFVRNPDCLITERAYWLFRETQCWGKPFWVIQGADGGHKRWFSPTEQKFLKLAGLDSEPPAPGDLPYAPFDGRVMARLREWDLMKGEHAGLRRSKKLLQGAASARYESDERAFRERLVKWLTEQMTEAADDGRVMKSLQLLDAPRSPEAPRELERRTEQAEQNFIETGRTAGGAVIGRRE